MVNEATCPVVAILDVQDRAFIREAARLGIFASTAHGEDPGELQSAIEIAMRRFADYHGLEAAFERRAATERAKGILMERHSIGQEKAFAMLRNQARRTNHKIVDIAEAVLASHGLLPSKQSRARITADEPPTQALRAPID
jgi:response regulator NasT